MIKPISTSVSVVFLGTLEPGALLLPSLLEHKAIGESDSEAATYEALLRDQIVDIKFEWCRLVCLTDRLTIESPQVPFVRVLDLAAKCIREVSPNSLVKKFGINVTCQYAFSSMHERDKFGQRLSPLSAWGAWGESIRPTLDSNSPLLHGGLLKATVRKPRDHGELGGFLDLHVESATGANGLPLVVLKSNDHFEPLEGNEKLSGFSPRMISEFLVETAEAGFDRSIEESMAAMESVMSGVS